MSALERRKGANPRTESLHESWYHKDLPFLNSDDRYLETVTENLISSPKHPKIIADSGRQAWTFVEDKFVGISAPVTVNPSLWRQAQINSIAGLFKVVDGMYQIRGYDISVMTIIESNNGIIIIDPLTSNEPAHVGLELYFEKFGKKKIVAVIYSHSHADHFQGSGGIITPEQAARGDVQVIAPEGFYHHVCSENLFAGVAMLRRAMYMYGSPLPFDPKGSLDCGIGKATSSGTASLIPPTKIITKFPIEQLVVDGIEIEFQLVPDTEAPSEMNMYFPQFRVFDIVEQTTHTMHNIYTIRGALVRDSKAWSWHLNNAIDLFCHKTDVLISQHGLPIFGKQEVVDFISDHRDMYKYIHDQTLRLLNKGFSPLEISEQICTLPPELANKPHCREYYGHLKTNIRAVYQRYLGFYDGHPTSLDQLGPVDAGKRYVDLAGGMDAIVAKAKSAYEKDDLQWCGELLRHAIYADPNHMEARNLLADTLEQQGYRTENATWRNAYLTGAFELRQIKPPQLPKRGGIKYGMALDVAELLDYASIAINGLKVIETLGNVKFVWLVDGHRYILEIRNGTLNVIESETRVAADAEVESSRAVLYNLISQNTDLNKEIADGRALVKGDANKLCTFFNLLELSAPDFPIVLPRNASQPNPNL